MDKIGFVIILVFLSLGLFQNVFATITTIEEDNIRATITYPEGVVRGSDFNISILIVSLSSYDRTNVTMKIISQPEIFYANNNFESFFDRLADHSSYGQTFSFSSFPNSTLGQHFLNAELSHVDTSENVRYYSTALPIIIREEPKLVIKTEVQDSIYTNAEFPFLVEIESQGSNLRDVSVKIIPPTEITFRGQTLHTFSSIDRDTPITLRAVLVTSSDESIGYEHYIPFQIVVDYTDDTDTERTTSKSVSVLLRPKAFFELGAQGGFWIGDFYFTPTISFGTLIGIGVGLFGFNKWYKKRTKRRARKS